MLGSETSPFALDLAWVRSQYPSLAQTVNGQPAAFLDGPGGTQVRQRVIDAISRATGRELKPGDEIVANRLDHEAKCSPWLQMAEDRGVTVR
jgi:selenocysteine lyase/cysteine desulfurase